MAESARVGNIGRRMLLLPDGLALGNLSTGLELPSGDYIFQSLHAKTACKATAR